MKNTKLKILLSLAIYNFIFWSPVTCFADSETVNLNSRGLEWDGPRSIADNAPLKGNYRAVVIGNNQYLDENGIWKDLKTAVNDAVAVATILQINFGFTDVTLLTNANRKEILHSLKEISTRAEPNDSILIYYAGHGHLEDGARRGYWIPVDGQGLDDTTFIRNSTIRDEIRLIAEKTKHTLLLSDSCFSGSLLRGGNRGPSNFEISQGYYQKVGNKKSVQVFAAGGTEYVDDNYNNSGHSPFTYFLLNELKTTVSTHVSLSEIATNVIKAVANNVDQTPEAGVLQGAGDELGEFIFARVEIETNSPKATAMDEPTDATQNITTVPDADSRLKPSPVIPAFRF